MNRWQFSLLAATTPSCDPRRTKYDSRDYVATQFFTDSGLGIGENLQKKAEYFIAKILEYMYDPGYWNADGFQAGFACTYPIRQGLPGLGIEWDRQFFKKYGLEHA